MPHHRAPESAECVLLSWPPGEEAPPVLHYLLGVSLLEAGLDGIEKGLKLTDPVEESLFEMTADRVAEKGSALMTVRALERAHRPAEHFQGMGGTIVLWRALTGGMSASSSEGSCSRSTTRAGPNSSVESSTSLDFPIRPN